MPSDSADVLDETYRRALELGGEAAVDPRGASRRVASASALVHAAERALRDHRAELAVLLCLAACRSGAVEGHLEEVLSDAFASVRCLHVIPEAHPGGASAVAWSPDDALLATGGADATLKLWSSEQARLTAELRGHEERIRRIEFNEVWPLVSSCGDDGAAIVWDLASRKEAWRAQGLDASALAARFSPCGRRAAIAGGVEWSGLRDSRTGELIFPFSGHDGIVVYEAAFSSDGRFLATCGDDGRAIIRDVETAAIVGQVTHQKPVRTVAFDPSSTRMVCASYDGAVSVLTIESGERRVFEANLGRALAASFVNDGRDVWAVYERGAQRLFGKQVIIAADLATPTEGAVLATCVRRYGRVIATADHHGVTRVNAFEGDRLGPRAVLSSAGAATLGLDLTNDAGRAATADADGSVRIWSLQAEDAADRTMLHGQALLDAVAAWRRASGRAPARLELELIAIGGYGSDPI